MVDPERLDRLDRRRLLALRRPAAVLRHRPVGRAGLERRRLRPGRRPRGWLGGGRGDGDRGRSQPDHRPPLLSRPPDGGLSPRYGQGAGERDRACRAGRRSRPQGDVPAGPSGGTLSHHQHEPGADRVGRSNLPAARRRQLHALAAALRQQCHRLAADRPLHGRRAHPADGDGHLTRCCEHMDRERRSRGDAQPPGRHAHGALESAARLLGPEPSRPLVHRELSAQPLPSRLARGDGSLPERKPRRFAC